MSSISPATSLKTQTANSIKGNDLQDVNLDDFLKLLITELQNQDPMDPLDNSEILQQISQIREIGATNQLTETLEAVRAGQNLATASSLIGRQVSALDDAGNVVEGVVDRVSIEAPEDKESARVLRVHMGEQSVDLDNIRGVIGGGA